MTELRVVNRTIHALAWPKTTCIHERVVSRTIFSLFIIFPKCMNLKPLEPNTSITRTPCIGFPELVPVTFSVKEPQSEQKWVSQGKILTLLRRTDLPYVITKSFFKYSHKDISRPRASNTLNPPPCGRL